MEDLLFEYKRTLKTTKALYRLLQDEEGLTAEQMKDKKLIRSMITDLEYVVDWLEHGREPGIRRSIDRRDSYKRMLIKDPQIIDTFSEGIRFEPVHEVSAADKARIEAALSVLTAREKEIFILHKVERFSYERIAAMLGIKKSTVQTNVKRAQTKMKKQVKHSADCPA
ncbi:positive control sigma-like factor [Bacillus glycinifermentans]|mgnify:CR=1 FL=1|uniref:Fis family transcriptional regulator n=1 Tax=Bacillus glycinifermentans TaxID=1664069 RepID=A0A0J6E363_9BACI|nr:sigma-70 family RNA polymerase sigma factor [Bacillus glycinifermentans]ATH95205.1 Fis family transcriptional regulator [Bacillus glycinifermentans]KMM52999.1 positive control sigma-like factor [Bacillus glycinifermentans]KRT89375.1 Fis family transcriptional regulator [Bacillus glycinifermentans]MEC0483278.1 sigma-70 family RNA polymerase sigma factor [Bacillus glycinifermentans]MEC0493101.1 sigma-70 family RNA polymerase sigma factor [Bacillus glycinifermentans]